VGGALRVYEVVPTLTKADPGVRTPLLLNLQKRKQFQCLQIIWAKYVPKMSYFALKSSKIVSFWALRPQIPGPPAARGVVPDPLLLNFWIRPWTAPKEIFSSNHQNLQLKDFKTESTVRKSIRIFIMQNGIDIKT